MEKLLTVFTPTYNRVNLIHKCYESLKRQTLKDFEWLIIDDGSSDNTKDIVQNWINTETEFKIKYIYKENGGLQTAYIEAIKNLNTELAMCVDSDDYLEDNAIYDLVKFWNDNRDAKYAGIVARNTIINQDKQFIFNENSKEYNSLDFARGEAEKTVVDIKYITRTEVYKTVLPAKQYKNERSLNDGYLQMQIAMNYSYLILNKSVCIVEYLDSGISRNKLMQYFSSPNNFADLRLYALSLKYTLFSFRFKQQIHYVFNCIVARRKTILKDSPRKIETFMAIPFGVALTIYIKFKIWKKRR